MTISILGSGWLGHPLAHYFIQKGYRVKASTTSTDRISELKSIDAEPFIVNIDVLTDDIKDFLQAEILIVNIPSKNVEGFSHLVNKVEASKVEKVLFISSTSVYQNINRTLTESDIDFYSSSPLLEIERLFIDWGSDQTTILRFGGLIGYRRHPGRFFKSGRIVQNPNAPVNLIHRDDCIGLISRIIEQEAWGEVFNGCTDSHPTKRAFYTRATTSLGLPPPEFGESDPNVGKLISNEKVKQALNYQFRHPDLMQLKFEEGF